MPFLNQLANNDTGAAPQTGSNSAGFDPSSLIPLLRGLQQQKENQHYRTATFDNNMSLRNASIRARMDPFTGQERSPWAQEPTNTVFKDNNPDITPEENLRAGIQGKELGLKTAELKNTLGKQAFDQNLETKKLDLEKQKSDQIYGTKQADMQRKVDDANQKLGLAYDKLQQNANDVASHSAFLKAKSDADEARHALEMSAKDAAHQETIRVNNAKIADLEKQRDAASRTRTTTEVNPEGNKRTVTTEKGSPKGKILVVGPDGKRGYMDAGELKDYPAYKQVDE